MKKLLLLTAVLVFVLCACGRHRAAAPAATPVESTVGSDPASKATQAIVEKWIAAYQDRDAKGLLALYSDDVVWNECSTDPCYHEGLTELKGDVPSSYGFGNPGFKVEAQSYFVTNAGQKAVVQTLYTDPNTQSVNAPSVTVLQIKDGKITSETWYSAAMP
ncbi:MAG TPA: nuclear transport factor 2 family protein [Anaerolineales bacterium]|nr:nuclear transport factor 2 family protein [Anaerolineales bacterium]